MTQNVKISIIVPAYNVAEWLPRCVDSIIDQTHKNWELLLIDDGSTDDTSRIVDRYAQRDKRIIAIHQENAGLVEVREKGISLGTGDYVGFVDSDDAIDSDMYERLLYNAMKYRAEISHCGLRVCYGNGLEELHYGTGKILIQNSIESIKELLSGEQFDPSLCNKLYKRELLYNSCLDRNVLNSEDLLRNFVLFKRANTIVYEDFCGYQYWSRENSMSNNSRVVARAKSSILAKEQILKNSDEEERIFALRAWLSTIVNVINELTLVKSCDAKIMCADCRKKLREEKRNIKILMNRQRFVAWLIVLSPSLHRLVYKIYKKR